MKKISSSGLGAELNSTIGAQQSAMRSNPDQNPWSVGICRVFQVNYEEMTVSLRTLTGTSFEFDRAPVAVTMPGSGMRHFFGAMPEIGDLCICSWTLQSSMSKGQKVSTRVPVIVGWMPRGQWLGQDWVVEQPFAPNEHDFATERQKLMVAGTFQRTRHKMRHMQPGKDRKSVM